MTVPNWRGIHSVLVTPFDAAGKIDFKRFEALVDANIANGADGVIVCGSTGEFYTMTIEERDALFKATVSAAANRAPVLAGVSDLRTGVTLDLCRRAEAAGCAGILALPPIYAVPDEREVDHFYRAVAGASGLPVMLYNSPRRTNVSLGVDQVARLAEVPTVAAIKDSSGDIVQVTELARRLGGKISVFVGYETMIRSALPVGAVGVVAMAHQLSGRLVRAYFDACKAGDKAVADRLEPALFAIYRCFRTGSYYAGIKATMNALDQPVGSPREPLLPFSEAQTAKVAAILAEARVADVIRSLA
jgi:4-hydroxy-tetrahydrodipicolinate synthase